MYMTTAARDGFAVRPVDYYLDAWRSLYEAGLAQPLLAEFQGQPLAAVIIVRYGRRAIYMYGASTNLGAASACPTICYNGKRCAGPRPRAVRSTISGARRTNLSNRIPLWGVWRFKAGFNGRVVRHIGAWDYPNRPFWYWIYTTVMPRYLAFLRGRNNAQLTAGN